MHTTLPLLSLCLVLAFGQIHGQCPSNQITLNTQAEVNAFSSNYPGCTHLLNTLYISGSNITSLTPLSGITAIDGALLLYENPNLTTLAGLSNLDSALYISISGNPALQNLTGLSGLDKVQLFLSIEDNDGMLNLNGINNLSRIGPNGNDGFLGISGNDLLDNLNGAPLLDSLSGLFIDNNPSLSDVTGLEGLKYADTIGVSNNATFQNFNGFTNLQKVGKLRVEENPQLANFQGLPLLTQLDTLFAKSNNSLINFSGLESLTEMVSCIIWNNPALINFMGLNNVELIYELNVINNDACQNFTGLTNLFYIIELFAVSGNLVLTDFTGLDNLSNIAILSVVGKPGLTAIENLGEMMGFGYSLNIANNPQLSVLNSSTPLNVQDMVSITNNPLLEYCCILLAPSNLGPITLSENAPSCNSLPQVNTYCDGDDDDIFLANDNCPTVYNPLQQDYDADGFGNGCDNCPMVANADQSDTNDNFIGNACELPETGKIGLSTVAPKSQLDVSGGDLYLNNTQRGIILKNYLGNCFRLLVDENGQLITMPITCPN